MVEQFALVQLSLEVEIGLFGLLEHTLQTLLVLQKVLYHLVLLFYCLLV